MPNAIVGGWPSGSDNTVSPQEPTRMLMPGRVQGWPAGTQRAANPATTLLSQAVAWWDVEQYREGDRFLRNRGTGGELLDLRLGSSIVANSNDPLYLPTADEGYVYLSGVAGNSLSVTAPATATNFVAYPLDRSASNTTGSVTGGATFTFSTTGSWRLIELRDASNVVLDTINCDAITSGSNTSFLSVGNQTVTINRSTSGRKSVAMPSRSKGGQPVMLLGTDDYLEVQDNWQHGLLNFAQGDSFTVLAVYRMANFTTGQPIVAKRSGTSVAGNPGYILRNQGATPAIFQVDIGDGVSQSAGAGPSRSAMQVQVSTVTKAGTQQSLYVGSTSTTGTNQAGSLVTPNLFRIGRLVDNNTYGDMEFYGAAVFRRALSPAEITTLSNYFNGKIA